MNAFVYGIASDLKQRCESLIAELETHLCHQDVMRFRDNTVAGLRHLRKEVDDLLSSDEMNYRGLWKGALDTYESITREVYLLESYAVPVILRYGDRDHNAARLVWKLAQEIGYPQDRLPTIITTSDRYYWTLPPLDLISMPAGDAGGSILGWPDVVHEMAHNLLARWPDFLADFSRVVQRHFKAQRDKLNDLGISAAGSPAALLTAQIRWQDGLDGTWRSEMASDLIATYCVGSAYGWQHLRLTVDQSDDPYHPCPPDDEVHPCPQARLDGIVAMLNLLGQQQEVTDLNNQWRAYLQLKGYSGKPAGYDRYYHTELIKALASVVHTSSQRYGLVPFSHSAKADSYGLVGLIDKAWSVLRTDPESYVDWESTAMLGLKEAAL